LRLRLNSLGHDFNAKTLAKVDYRPDDRIVARIRLHVTNEAAVNLDDIDRKLLQVAQRGIAGSEIIQGDLHAVLVEERQRPVDVFRPAAKENCFGDFELEAACWDLGAVQALQHPLGEAMPLAKWAARANGAFLCDESSNASSPQIARTVKLRRWNTALGRWAAIADS